MSDEFDDDVYPPDQGSTLGMFVGIFAQAAVMGAVMLVSSPIWVPALICNRVRRFLRPEPKPTGRGTVRPMGGPAT